MYIKCKLEAVYDKGLSDYNVIKIEAWEQEVEKLDENGDEMILEIDRRIKDLSVINPECKLRLRITKIERYEETV